MGTSFTWNIFFIHTPIFTNVNRGYILGEIHRVSTQILDENACKYNIKHKQTYNKNSKGNLQNKWVFIFCNNNC